MARKSRKVDYVNVGNKENLVTEAENQCEKVSHAALYARLSYESEKNRERNTIETQMVLLHNFVKEQKDIVVAKEYYDISKTGTNFERDGFNEMMQEIKEGNIDCVIVKDLSRLGRNYVEAGSYIERVFPFFNVRFISVNDHYDSFRDDISLLISMSNVYNEFYSRDLAKKIRSSYRTSWANGEFPSGQMAYGYEKDKDNPHQLIPDPVAAPVVKKIFQYFIDGMTYAEIARKLNADEYLCPKAYKLDKAGKANEKSATWTWSGGTVHKILENQYYAGDSVHNQFTNDSWAAQRQKMNQKEEWIIIKNTHEALVSRKDFDEVQEKIGHIVKRVNEARKSNGNNVRDFNFFKQKIVCADCGKTMYLYGKTKGNAAAGCGKGITGDFAVCGGNFERSKGEGIKPGRAVQRAERQLLYGGRHLEGEHLFLVIIAEKMFPEYGRDELFLSQTERIALNACLEAVRIEVAGKVKLNRSGSARSKVGRRIPQGDFHSGDGGGRGVRVVRMCFFRIGVDFLLWQHVCNRLLRCGIFLTEKFEDIVDIAEFRTDFLIGETLAAGVGEMGFEIV